MRGCSAALCGLLSGAGLVLFGLLTVVLFPLVFHQLMREMMSIVPGTPAYEAWKNPTMPTKIRSGFLIEVFAYYSMFLYLQFLANIYCEIYEYVLSFLNISDFLDI